MKRDYEKEMLNSTRYKRPVDRSNRYIGVGVAVMVVLCGYIYWGMSLIG